MKLTEQLPRRNIIKYILLVYLLISVIYTVARFYDMNGISSSQSRATRRSMIESTNISSNNSKEAFFVAPLTQDSIEQDEESELKNMVENQQQKKAYNLHQDDSATKAVVEALENAVMTENKGNTRQKNRNPIFSIALT